jgi:TDG/mug DNA glycosylase family protein
VAVERQIGAWLRTLPRDTRLGVLARVPAQLRSDARRRGIECIPLGRMPALTPQERAALDAALVLGFDGGLAWTEPLARLHARLRPRAPVLIAARTAPAAERRALLEAAGFELREPVPGAGPAWPARRRTTLPDFVRRDLRLLVCGLNPSLHAARSGIPFSRPGNRFWPAALRAGLVARDRDPFDALERGIGFTDLCKRPTRAAGELRPAEYARGLAELEDKLRRLGPRALCFVGLAGWRAVVDRNAGPGWIPAGFAGRPAYLMPSTSGLNARSSPAELSRHLARVYHARQRGAPRHRMV